MKTFRSTFIFALVVVAVIGYAIFEVKRGEELEIAEKAADRVFNWNEKDVSKVLIKRDNDSFEIVREEDNWKLTQPVQDRADGFMVTNYLTSLLNQSAKEIEGNNEQWKDYGLENSTVDFILTGPKEEVRKIQVSREEAYDGSYFLRQGKRLLVGNSEWKKLINKKSNEVRAKGLFHRSAPVIGFRIRVPGKKVSVQLEKKDGKWIYPKDLNIVISSKEVDKFIMDSTSFQSVDFVAEEAGPKVLARFGLGSPQLTIDYWLEGEKQAGPHWWVKVSKAKIGNEGFAYHKDRQTIYSVPEDTVSLYTRTLNDFRDKKYPFEFKKDVIQELSLKTRLTNLALVKQDGKWVASNPVKGKKVDQLKVKTLLDKLGEMEAKYYLGQKRGKEFKKLVNTVVLKDNKGKEVLSVKWGASFKAKKEEKTDSKEEEDFYYVKTNREKEMLGVSVTAIDALPGQTLLKDVSTEPSKKKDPAPMSKKAPVSSGTGS